MAKGATDKKCCTLSPSLFPRNIRDASPIPCIFSSHFLLLFRQREREREGKSVSYFPSPLLIPIFDSSLSRPAPSCCLETARILSSHRAFPLFPNTNIRPFFPAAEIWTDSVSSRSGKEKLLSTQSTHSRLTMQAAQTTTSTEQNAGQGRRG